MRYFAGLPSESGGIMSTEVIADHSLFLHRSLRFRGNLHSAGRYKSETGLPPKLYDDAIRAS